MNPSVKFIDKALRVGKENEEVFDDNFWENLDIVINAVDNVNARRYIDD
jgi:ubiquitin-activating enzyme E1